MGVFSVLAVFFLVINATAQTNDSATDIGSLTSKLVDFIPDDYRTVYLPGESIPFRWVFMQPRHPSDAIVFAKDLNSSVVDRTGICDTGIYKVIYRALMLILSCHRP
jgi:hypothetical protein